MNNARLPELIVLTEDYDMVIGSRTADDVNYSRIRKIPKYFLVRWVNWITKTPVPGMNSGMRVFRKMSWRSFLVLCQTHSVLPPQLPWQH